MKEVRTLSCHVYFEELDGVLSVSPTCRIEAKDTENGEAPYHAVLMVLLLIAVCKDAIWMCGLLLKVLLSIPRLIKANNKTY